MDPDEPADRPAAPRRRRLAVVVASVTGVAAVALVVAIAAPRTQPSPLAGMNRVSLWLVPHTAPHDAAALLARARAAPGITTCSPRTSLQDYRGAMRLIPAGEHGVPTPTTTPASIRCVATTREAVVQVVRRFRNAQRVYAVTAPAEVTTG